MKMLGYGSSRCDKCEKGFHQTIAVIVERR